MEGYPEFCLSDLGERPPLTPEDLEVIARFLSGEVELSLIPPQELSDLMIRADLW